MSYDNFEHSCNRGTAGRPWVGAILIVKVKDWNERDEEMWERDGGSESARPWPGRRVIQMKLEAYEKCVFLYPNAHLQWPHLITDHQSETERTWEGGRRRSHMKGDREYIFHLVLQSSQSSSSLTCFFGLLSGFICAIFVSIETVSWMQIPNFFFIFRKAGGHSSSLWARWCILAHESKNVDPVVNARCVNSRRTQFSAARTRH